MKLQIVTPPSGEPVTVAFAKSAIRFTHAFEDDLIAHWIATAREYCETNIGRPVRPAAWMVTAESPDAQILVYGLGAFTVTEARAITGASSVVIPESDMTIGWDHSKMVIEHNSAWPTADRIEMDISVGYQEIPYAIKQAILLLVGGSDQNRESSIVSTGTTHENRALNDLLYPYRVLGL